MNSGKTELDLARVLRTAIPTVKRRRWPKPLHTNDCPAPMLWKRWRADSATRSSFATMPVIRRFFFVLLILILPFQAVWAAVSAYCLHEQGVVATQHFGHHDHRHHAGPADSKDGTTRSALQPHADCGFCHLNCPAAPSAAPVVAVIPGAFAAVDPPWAYLSVFPEGPERPKWAPAA